MKISIIVPVLHEKNINLIIRRINKLKAFELIIVEGDSKGSTINNILNKTTKRIISKVGRANQMNAGAKKATGDVLMFLHADSIMPKNTVELINKTLDNKSIVGGAFKVQSDSNDWYFKLSAFLFNARIKLSRIPHGDNTQFFRRNYFEKIGSYKSLPLMEDIEIMERIKKHKDKIQIIKTPVIVSSRRHKKEGPLYVTLRNFTILTLYHLGVHPKKLVKWYRQGKVAYR